MTEILQFPKNKIVREVPIDNERLEKAKTQSVKNFAESLVANIGENILLDLEQGAGLEVTPKNEDFTRDFFFALDVLRATIYRQLELDHHLHDYINEHVKVSKLDDMDFYKDEISEYDEEKLLKELLDIEE
jgi:hypothetical protein